MRVLLTVASFSQDYGGPALSVSRLGAALALGGAEVALWAPDGSAATAEPAAVAEALANRDGRQLIRLSGSLDAAFAAFPRPDVVHDNGIWLAHNHALAKRAHHEGAARIVSLRGMLEPWAFRYKGWKKRLAFALYQRRDLATAAVIHATSHEEAAHFGTYAIPTPVSVVPNGMDLPVALPVAARSEGGRRILFLSRIHPKKGLPILIEAFARLRPEGWRVVVAGPDELGHAAEMAALAKKKGVADAFDFVGPRYGLEKDELLARADLFVLPTYSENFGMAVAEALAHAVPVLTTTGAPWAQLTTAGCGWWVAPTVEAFTAALAQATALSDSDRARMGRRGRTLIADEFGWNNVAAQITEIYTALTPKPEISRECRP